MATIKSLRIMMYVDSKGVKSGMEKVKKTVHQAAREMAKTLATAFATRTIGQGLVAGIKNAIQFESFAVDLAVLGGDGSGLFNKLRDEAMASPFPIEDWMMGGKRLLGAEVPIEQLTHILSMLGDMAAGTGSSIKELGLVFTQVFAKGRLQGEEMLQFMERNVSLNKALQKVLGVNKEELQKMQEAGKITPDDVIKAMEEMTSASGVFGGMMDAKMQTMAGVMVRFGNMWKSVSAEFGQIMLPFLGAAVMMLSDMVVNGGLIKGFFSGIAAILDLVVFSLSVVVMMFHILDRLTFGWLGWIVGVSAALAFIFIVVGVIQKGLMLITANTGLWAFATGLVAKGMALIGLEMTAASWGLNLLVATIIAGLVAILAWLSKITFGQTADKFNKMKEDAQEIAKSMKQAATASSPKAAMFGTMEGSNAIRKANNQQKQWQDQMLEETKKNREANEESVPSSNNRPDRKGRANWFSI